MDGFKSLSCYVKKTTPTIVHFFRQDKAASEQFILSALANAKTFLVTSNTECFARWLSNPYTHFLVFISSIHVSRRLCCLCLPMSNLFIVMVVIFLLFLGRRLLLATVILFTFFYYSGWCGPGIIRDSNLFLVPSFWSGIGSCCFAVYKPYPNALVFFCFD